MFRRSAPGRGSSRWTWIMAAVIILILVALAVYYFYYSGTKTPNGNGQGTNGGSNGENPVDDNGSAASVFSVSPCVGNIANNTHYANPAIAAGLDPSKLCIRPTVLNAPSYMNPVRGPETAYYQWFYDGKPTCVGGWGVAGQSCVEHVICADDLMHRASGQGPLMDSVFGDVDAQMRAVAQVVNGELPGGGNPYCPVIYTVAP